MARGTGPLTTAAWPRWPAALASGAILVLLAGAVAGLLGAAGRLQSPLAVLADPFLRRVAGFTILQALLSTGLSILLALPLARALARHPRFAGRGAVLALFALPLVVPALVAAVALLALLGRSGLAAPVLTAIAGERWPGIYGLTGILVAHVFFNLPLAARIFLAALDTVPDDQWRLARHLGLGIAMRWRIIEWPVLKAALPGLAVLVFSLCLTSFTLVLVLGGGPRATTLEVAIYQALRVDFEPARVLSLALLQMAIGLGFAVLAARFRPPDGDPAPRINRSPVPPAGLAEKAANGLVIAAGVLFVGLPLAVLVGRGLAADLPRLLADPAVHRAVMTSLMLAGASALLAVAAALALLAGSRAFTPARHLVRSGAGLLLVLSPVMIGAGWFILLRPVIDPFAAAPAMVVSVNAVMALPFVLALLRPGWEDSAARHDRLARSLGLAGVRRLAIVELRLLARPLGLAAAFAASLSLGDLGAIALWGSDRLQTLPWLLHARLGAYRTDDAAGLALILLVLCALVLAFGRLAARDNGNPSQ